ncbi:MAG: bifunctional pyr operon transcriptional regulator/uracil phosphoribosyltransferase PyrR [Vulcanimicrobiaceae bacterium]
MNATTTRRVLLEAAEIERTIARLAHQIVEPHACVDELVMMGVRRGGEALARRIADCIGRIAGTTPALGFLNIDLYRDDEVSHDLPESLIPVDVAGKTVVVVDDVLYTGRTVRSALDAVTDLGRPAVIRLCVLVDRGLRELPVQGDFVGRFVPTSRRERIVVNIAPVPSQSDEVVLFADPA